MMNQKLFSLKRSNYKSSTVIIVTVLFVLTPGVGFTSASAHTSVNVENIQIDVGWDLEPPVVGIRNDFVFKIVELGEREGTYTGITSAFKNLDATAMYGGATKKVDINSDPRAGYYFSPVIPTKTGSIQMELKGEINGISIDVQIPIEDVESTAILDFPQRNTQTSSSEISALKNAVSALQMEVSSILESNKPVGNGTHYDLVVFSLSLGIAGVILAIVSMTRMQNKPVNQK